ncbi:MAG: hypothetical protein ACUVX8_00535 [Candidatus Zipacnadales bacterium]
MPTPAPMREVTALALAPGNTVNVDGILDETCWDQGLWIGEWLLKDSRSQRPEANTALKVRFDERTLYIAIRADEPNMDALRAMQRSGRDVPAWTDDCIEVWVEPANSRQRAYHLIFSIAGGMWDALEWTEIQYNSRAPVATSITRTMHIETAWNSTAHAAFAREPASWTCEIALPMIDFGLERLIFGSTWAFNVGRERWTRPGGGEFSSLTGVFSWPRELFANLRLGLSPVRVMGMDLGTLGLGENPVRFSVASPRRELDAVEVRLTVTTPATQTIRSLLPLSGAAPVSFAETYRLEKGGEVNVTLELLRPGTEDILYWRTESRQLSGAILAQPSAPIRYVGRDPWWVDVELVVGRTSLARAKLRVQLLAPNGRVLRIQTLSDLRERMRLHLNMGSPRTEGTFTVRLIVLDGRCELGRTDVPVRILAPPV